MPAGILDFKDTLRFEAGSRYDETFIFKDAGGSVINLTAYSIAGGGLGARMMLRKTEDETVAPILSLGTPGGAGQEGIEITNAAGGEITIVIRPATLAAKSFDTAGAGTPLTANRSGVVQIEVVGATEANVLRLTEGTFEISPEVAR